MSSFVNRMTLLQALTRRKPLGTVCSEQSQLGKVLSTWDLIALGVGSTLGVGVYVLPGIVAREVAGPGVVFSFFYAAVASVLAGRLSLDSCRSVRPENICGIILPQQHTRTQRHGHWRQSSAGATGARATTISLFTMSVAPELLVDN